MVLSLVDKEGKPSSARLYVQVVQDSISAAAGDAVKQARASAGKLSRPLISDVSDAMLNKQSLVTTFDALLMQFKPLVKIGDEISKVFSQFFPVMIRIHLFSQKIHPYVNFAWTVLSAGMKASSILLLILRLT